MFSLLTREDRFSRIAIKIWHTRPLFTNDFSLLLSFRTESAQSKENATDVHPVPDPGAGEGVPLQPLPDQEAPHRDRPQPGPHRAPDQDLVPEPEDEGQEGDEGGVGGRERGRG